MTRDLLVLHVRDERPHARHYQGLLNELNASAMRALTGAGWQPTLLATATIDEQELLDRARAATAVVIMGGEDVDPRLYGGSRDYPGSGSHEPESDRAMIAVIRQSLRLGTPLLGVCRGHQLLNVALGGSLIEHMDGHRASGQDRFVATPVIVSDGEPDAFAVGDGALCTHHQAVRTLGDDLRVVARAADGTIEAIAHRTAPLFGVQWHPEHPATADAQLVALMHATLAATPVPGP